MNISEIRKLTLNENFVSKIILEFLKGYDGEIVPFYASYLVLPFILDEKIRHRLKRADKRTRIETIFKRGNDEVSESLIRLQDQIAYYEDITNRSLILLSNQDKIEIRNAHLIVKTDLSNDVSEMKEYLKSSYLLGKAFSKENLIHLLLKLGVKNI